jgi:membrane protease YdiL (CAAX protease family)
MNGIVGIGLVYVFLRFDRHKLKVVGFEWSQLKAKEWILVSIPITIAGLVPTVIIELIFGIITFGNLLDPITMVMTFIVTFFAIALGEEILFRGYLHSILETRYSFSFAAIVSAALFGLLHFLLATTGRNLFHMFAILLAAFVIGLALSYTYKITGYNLILPVAIHGFWDFFLFMFEADFIYEDLLHVIMETVASAVGAVMIYWAVKYYAEKYQNLSSEIV